ncbi:ArsR family transcriptional regulator, partial [Bacillus tropicus]|nr:ArsR family transcriptional regulator [Bacillus tropicus]
LKEIAEGLPQVCEDEKAIYNRLLANAYVKTLANMCEGDCSCFYQIKVKK